MILAAVYARCGSLGVKTEGVYSCRSPATIRTAGLVAPRVGAVSLVGKTYRRSRSRKAGVKAVIFVRLISSFYAQLAPGRRRRRRRRLTSIIFAIRARAMYLRRPLPRRAGAATRP
ncbi:hypothetical protein EVAR_10770_1 [Eumeta japonica]|uniref:Uncharacterized protein n=1 Tax=Eumeta variegata TaxID=151549 RepID=A0A4C1W8H6_EUMVA|nr:hypothetical protein EVAR_10770_1 [Eumeta japonica]